MNLNRLSLFLCILLIYCCTSSRLSKTTELEKINTAFGSVLSYRARTKTTMVLGDGVSVQTTGQCIYKKPQMLKCFTKQEKKGGFEAINLTTDKIRWSYSKILGNRVAFKTDLRGVKFKYGDSYSQYIDHIDKNSIRFMGQKIIDGVKYYLFEGKPTDIVETNEKDEDKGRKFQFLVNTKDGILRKMVESDRNGNIIGKQIISDVEINIPISDEEFEFVPPEGTQIIDMTP